jgi:hypothetical protein
MSYDLAISENGDLIMTANRDLSGISGSALLEQRIRLRLRVRRGQWIFDSTQTLGSQLFTLSGLPAADASKYARAYVLEALKDMEEISVEDVQIQQTTKDISLIVVYQQILTQDDSSIPSDQGLQDLSITVPIIAANE